MKLKYFKKKISSWKKKLFKLFRLSASSKKKFKKTKYQRHTGQHDHQPRGIRNNNPGNIRHGDNWVGMCKKQRDKSFVQFDDPRYGIRAMARILNSYERRGVVTIQQVITTWAPPTENNTSAYVNSVSRQLGVKPGTRVKKDHYPQLIAAIIQHENGHQPYSMQMIREGVNLV
ncbi:structural protein [Endozoicomonadaceae bacterium StTr2]